MVGAQGAAEAWGTFIPAAQTDKGGTRQPAQAAGEPPPQRVTNPHPHNAVPHGRLFQLLPLFGNLLLMKIIAFPNHLVYFLVYCWCSLTIY